ncbi:hypothetical protein DFH01_04880 [Falsiroseomonas bella]|uniref:Uncharacterized protein n=1 Tax=Falsiroseomonas bella TaxID=2184016 RepID=A0A317FJW4_9PROT|nr:hypothetical protein [Falsiroseomonas bella]PWS38612.1 hypothetical protein DFH01_04880 [Falsiroseomonas bella]
MRALPRLWRGELPLNEAFWTWAVGVGLVVNLSTTLGFLVLIAQDRPIAALGVGYLVSVPYNILAAVGVWRAAAHYEGPPALAQAARLAVVIGMTVLSLT